MSKEIIKDLERDVREMVEKEPPAGVWKLTDSEMESLSSYLVGLLREAHGRGWEKGWDDCMETFREGAENLFGVKA